MASDAAFLDEHIANARAWMLGEIGRYFDRALAATVRATPELESPLERAFCIWFMALTQVYGDSLSLLHQYEIVAGGNRYRLDFMVTATQPDGTPVDTRIAVELDGHAFHEKTLEQVTRRNRRDRDLQTAGWQVFHYSFSEFVTRPAECAREVHLAAWQWLQEERENRDRLAQALKESPFKAKPDMER